MPLQLSETVRNARANQIESTIGASPTLEIRTGAPPADCAAAATGTLLVSIALPADWLSAAAAGVVSLAGDWPETNAVAAGTAAHFRVNQGATCHMQGTCTNTGGGGDLELQNVSIASGQPVDITAFTLTEQNA